ncbi:MAG: IS1182 family transposase [Xanthomonadales bacterium]|nr:IS1182 family transposase [Xanthomonadales bacterium]
MARYKRIDMSPRLLPVDLESQLVPGSFAQAVHHLVGELDLSAFDAHFRNDEVGASAHSPAMLLRAVLLAYSQGMVSSRAIERACRDNVVFIALTGDAKPHFTTIADFISRSRDAIACVFAQVLAILDGEGLIGRDLFAIDGVKLPSNASKHRSGTRAEFLAKANKLERVAEQMLDRHQVNDDAGREGTEDKVVARIERMTDEARKIRTWLSANPKDRQGTRGTIRKSNLTDNESAKMATDKGVIQGYCGVAVVDANHQVIVEAQAHGTGAEHALLIPILDACANQRSTRTLITADAGYHSEDNLAALHERGIDALIADGQMRQRDERLAGQEVHRAKPNPLHDKSRKAKPAAVFGAAQFIVADDQSHALCPAGKRLYRNGKECTINHYIAIKFRAPASACKDCALRTQCLRKPDITKVRQVAVLTRKSTPTHTQSMRERIDSEHGRALYGQRFATVEPVFGNLRHNKRLNRFTLRGQHKVDGQWKLFALVHNIEKWANYRKAA